jgi:hypothetical protein
MRRVAAAVALHKHAKTTVPPPMTLIASGGHSSAGWRVPRDVEQAKRWLVPAVFVASCLQCKLSFTAVVYKGPRGPALALFPAAWGGVTTPHTPSAVAFYLDQAARAQSVGAYSAAVVMYRAALEQILFDQGFKMATCGRKVEALRHAVREGNGPPWATDLDGPELTVLKELGDGAVHPNDGDIERQAALDETLVWQVEAALVELLARIYDEPARKAQRRAALEAARNRVTPPRQDRP